MRASVCRFKVGDEVLGRDKVHAFSGTVVFVSERKRVFVDFTYNEHSFQREFYRDGTMVTYPKSSWRKLYLEKLNA